MDSSRFGIQLLIGFASVAWSLPSASALAQDRAQFSTPSVTDRQMIRDVELARGGLLIGRLLNAEGQPLGNAEVRILSAGDILASTRTDADGVFAVAGLRGGVHQINTVETSDICRLWAHDTAPPRTQQTVVIVADSTVVRGQWGPPPANRLWRKATTWATNPYVIGGVVAAAVAIPIALSDDDGPHS